MDVTIERKKDGKSFKLEIGFFDTVLEIKEKIHKYHGMHSHKQSLFIRGLAMADDRDTEYYEVLEGSKLDLFFDDDEEENQASVVGGDEAVVVEDDDDDDNNDNNNNNDDERGRKRITFKITVSSPAMGKWIAMDVEGGETVAQLKEMIGIEGSGAGRTALMVGGVEMQDQKRTLREYGVVEGTEVSVVVRAAAAAAAAGKRMTVMVLVKGGGKKMGVEVNGMESVRELRKELERLEGLKRLVLPAEGYFFIYKQEVMEEERSFRWHGVKNNDTIEVFNGSVSGGA